MASAGGLNASDRDPSQADSGLSDSALSRNDDSLTLPSEFNYCAEGLDVGVFPPLGPRAAVRPQSVRFSKQAEADMDCALLKSSKSLFDRKFVILEIPLYEQ